MGAAFRVTSSRWLATAFSPGPFRLQHGQAVPAEESVPHVPGLPHEAVRLETLLPVEGQRRLIFLIHKELHPVEPLLIETNPQRVLHHG